MQSSEGAKECAKRGEVPVEVLKRWRAVVSEMCVWNRGSPDYENDAEMIEMRGDAPHSRAVIHEGVERGREEKTDRDGEEKYE